MLEYGEIPDDEDEYLNKYAAILYREKRQLDIMKAAFGEVMGKIYGKKR